MNNLPKDIKEKLLLDLSDKELVNVCQINKNYHDICNKQDFWLRRILYKFPGLTIDILEKYRDGRTWSDYYINDLNKISEEDLSEAVEDQRLDKIIVSISKGADIQDEEALDVALDYEYLDYINLFVKNNKDNIDSNLLKRIGAIDTDALEYVLVSKLKGQNLKKLCSSIYKKEMEIFMDTFNDPEYGKLLIQILFNPDVGLLHNYGVEYINYNETGYDVEYSSIRNKERAVGLILSKIDTPEFFYELYDSDEFPNKYVSRRLEIDEKEIQVIKDVFQNMNFSIDDIIEFSGNTLTESEAVLVLLIYTRYFRKGKIVLETKFEDVCKELVL